MLLTNAEINGLNTFDREAVEQATLAAKQLRAYLEVKSCIVLASPRGERTPLSKFTRSIEPLLRRGQWQTTLGLWKD
jgi:hypothetical protein